MKLKKYVFIFKIEDNFVHLQDRGSLKKICVYLQDRRSLSSPRAGGWSPPLPPWSHHLLCYEGETLFWVVWFRLVF